jgi:hypothetical protein
MRLLPALDTHSQPLPPRPQHTLHTLAATCMVACIC